MSDSTTGVTVTLKGGQGFEAPWIVIHAENAADALTQINDPAFANLAERSAAAAEFFRAANAGRQGFPKAVAEVQQTQPAPPAWSNGGSQQAAPAPQQQGGKQCVHGAMTYREGTGKASGKPYKAYFCPAPRGTVQCDPEFLK